MRYARSGFGPEWAKVMLVGDCFSHADHRAGRPFQGPAGDELRGYLMEAGVDPDDCYFTNVINAKPDSGDIREWFDAKTGRPNSLVIQGLQQLANEIALVNPNVIVALGDFALWALTGKAKWDKRFKKGSRWPNGMRGIHDWRGSVVEGTALTGGRKVICTFHPEFIRREGRGFHGLFLVDFAKISVEQDYPEVRPPEKELYLHPKGAERKMIVERIMDQPDLVVSADIEYINDKLLCVGFTNGRDWAATIGTFNQADLAVARKVLLEGGRGLCWQNAMFDASILEWHYNMPVMRRTVFDTMLAAHAANPELPKSLETLASIYTYPNQPNWKGMVNWNLVKKGKQSIMDVLKYNLIDVWVTHEVMEEQIKHDLSDPQIRAVFEFEMKLLQPLWEMARRGIRMDTEKLRLFQNQITTELAERRHLLTRITGNPDFKVGSSNQVAELLFDRLGLKPTKMNKTGPATDDKTLAELLIKAETDLQRGVINLIRDIRQREGLISKFLDVEFDEDERIRGIYNPAGTTTGRLASKKFYPTGRGVQQQNIPTRDKTMLDTPEGKSAQTVRTIFIPDTGMEFCYADLERAESLVVAHITGDPLMLEHHAPGADAHTKLAAILFNKPEEDVDPQYDRYLGKQTRHAGNYMQGPITFMRNVNKYANKTGVVLDQKEAKRLIGTYREIHPFLQQWWKDVEYTIYKTKRIVSIAGRPRTFYGHYRSIIPVAVAYNPQSTVGDVLNMGLLHMSGDVAPYVEKRGLAEYYMTIYDELRTYCDETPVRLPSHQLLNQVHDAIGFQYNRKYRDKILPLVRKLLSIPLTDPRTYEDFTIPVEIAIGPSWGEVEKWEEDLVTA